MIKKIGVSTRLVNFLIDSLIFMFIIFLHAMVLDSWLGIVPKGGYDLFPLYVFGLYVAYYLGFEHFFQKTPGKFVTKTKVVNKEGKKSSFTNILIRSLSRLIPLEGISFLFTDVGLHDSISNTYVVKDSKT